MPLLLLAACGGGGKKAPAKPATDTAEVTKAPPPETEADREKKRHDAKIAIIPEGSKCLPASLKDDGAPRLELAAVGTDAVVCAYDTDKSRMLGAIGCWKVDLSSGSLTYQDPAPLPGRGVQVALTDNCARGYCLPKDAKVSGSTAMLAWSYPDGAKVAMLVGDDVHLFDGGSKQHQSSFTIRGDKGVQNDPIGLYYVGDAIFVEAADTAQPFSGVWQFKADGTAVGPLVGIGKDEKPLSTHHGSFSILDKDHVGVAERGFTTLTTYEVSTGKRTKSVRRIGKLACKPAELETFWKDGDKVTDKCKGSAANVFGSLMGATAVMGSKSLLVMLRDDRLGDLAVMDPKTLAEKKTIKMPWCDAGGGDSAGSGGDDKKADKAPAGAKKAAAPAAARAPAPAAKSAKTGDPDEGGQ